MGLEGILHRQHHVLGVGHLGNGLGADEGHRLDPLEAGLGQLFDDGDLGVEGDQVMDILEPIPGAYLDQFHGFRQLHM